MLERSREKDGDGRGEGRVAGRPLMVHPDELVFRNAKINQTYIQRVHVTNPLQTAVNFSVIPGNCERFSVSPSNFLLEPEQSTLVEVRLRLRKVIRGRLGSQGLKDSFRIKADFFEQRFTSVVYVNNDENAAPQERSSSLAPRIGEHDKGRSGDDRSVVARLEHKIGGMEQKEVNLLQQLNDLEAISNRQANELKDKSERLAHSQMMANKLTEELNNLQSEKAEAADTERQDNLWALKEAQAKCDWLEERAAELEQDLRHKEEQNEQLKATVDKFNGENPDVTAMIDAELRRVTLEHEHKNEKVLAILEKKDKAIAALTSANAAYQAELKESQENIISARVQLDDIQKKCNDVVREKDVIAEQLEGLRKSSSGARLREEELKVELDELRSMNTQLEKQVKNLGDELESERAMRKLEVDQLEKERDSAKADMDRYAKRRSELESREALLGRVTARQNGASLVGKQSISELQSKVDDQAAQIDMLIGQISDMRKNPQAMDSLTRATTEALESTVANLKEECAQLRREKVEAERVYAEQVESLRKKLGGLVRCTAPSGVDGGDDLAEARSRIADLEATVHKLEAALRVAESGSARAAAEKLMAKDEELFKLQRQVQTLTLQIDLLHGPAHGVPKGAEAGVGNTDGVSQVGGSLDDVDRMLISLAQTEAAPVGILKNGPSTSSIQKNVQAMQKQQEYIEELEARVKKLEALQKKAQHTIMQTEKQLAAANQKKGPLPRHNEAENESVQRLNTKVNSLKVAEAKAMRLASETSDRAQAAAEEYEKTIQTQKETIARLQRVLRASGLSTHNHEGSGGDPAEGAFEADVECSLIARYKSLQEAFSAQEKSLDQMRKENVDLNSEAAELRKEIKNVEGNLSDEITKLQAELRFNRESGQMKLQSLEQTIRVLSGKSSLHAQLAQVNNRCDELLLKEARWRADSEHASSRLDHYRRELKERNNHISTLEKRIAEIGQVASHSLNEKGNNDVAIAAMSIKMESQQQEIKRLEGLLSASKAEAQQVRDGLVQEKDAEVGGVEYLASLQNDRNVELEKQLLSKARELDAERKRHRDCGREKDSAELRCGQLDATVRSLQADVKDLERKLHESRDGLSHRLMEMDADHVEEITAARKLTAEYAREQDEWAAQRKEMDDTISHLNEANSSLTTQLNEYKLLMARREEELDGRMQASAKERDAAVQEAHKVQALLDEKIVQTTILMETVENLQKTDDDKEQHIVSLTARLTSSKAVEAELERRAASLQAECSEHLRNRGQLQRANDILREEMRGLEGRVYSLQSADTTMRAEISAMKGELNAKDTELRELRRTSGQLREHGDNVRSEMKAYQEQLRELRVSHHEQLKKERDSKAETIRLLKEQFLTSSPAAVEADATLVTSLKEMTLKLSQVQHFFSQPEEARASFEDAVLKTESVERLESIILESQRVAVRQTREKEMLQWQLDRAMENQAHLEKSCEAARLHQQLAHKKMLDAKKSHDSQKSLMEESTARAMAMLERREKALSDQLIKANEAGVEVEAKLLSAGMKNRALAERVDVLEKQLRTLETALRAEMEQQVKSANEHVLANLATRDKAIRDYFNSEVIKYLLISDPREKVIALTRELCAQKVAEQDCMRKLKTCQSFNDSLVRHVTSLENVVGTLDQRLVELSAPREKLDRELSKKADECNSLLRELQTAKADLFGLQKELISTHEEVTRLSQAKADAEHAEKFDAAFAQQMEKDYQDRIEDMRESIMKDHRMELDKLHSAAAEQQQAHARETKAAIEMAALNSSVAGESALKEAHTTIMNLRKQVMELEETHHRSATALEGRGIKSITEAGTRIVELEKKLEEEKSYRNNLKAENEKLTHKVADLELDAREHEEKSEFKEKAFRDVEHLLAEAIDAKAKAKKRGPVGKPAPGVSESAAAMSKQIVNLKMSETELSRKLRVSARVERELRQQIATRDSRIRELRQDYARVSTGRVAVNSSFASSATALNTKSTKPKRKASKSPARRSKNLAYLNLEGDQDKEFDPNAESSKPVNSSLVSELEEERREAQERVAALESEKSILEYQLAEERSKHAHHEEPRVTLSQEFSEVLERLRASESREADLTREVSIMKDRESNLAAETRRLQAALNQKTGARGQKADTMNPATASLSSAVHALTKQLRERDEIIDKLRQTQADACDADVGEDRMLQESLRSVIDDLTMRVQALTDENSSLSRSLEDARAELRRSATAMQSAVGVVSQSTGRPEDHQKARDDNSKARSTKTVVKVPVIDARGGTGSERAGKSSSTSTDAHRRVTELEDELRGIESQYNDLIRSINETGATANDGESSAYDAVVLFVQNISHAVEETMASMPQSAASGRERVRALMTEFSVRSSELKSVVKRYEDSSDAKQGELKRVEADLLDCRGKLSAVEGSTLQLHSEIGSYKASVERLQEQVKQERDLNAVLKDTNDQLQSRITFLENRIQENIGMIRDEAASPAKLLPAREEAEEPKMDAIGEAIQQLAQEVVHHKKAAADSKGELETLRESERVLKTKISQLEEDVAAAWTTSEKDRRNAVEKEGELRRKIDDLEEKLVSVERQGLACKEKEKQELHLKIADLDRQLAICAEKERTTTQEISDLQALVVNYKEQIVKYEGLVKELTRAQVSKEEDGQATVARVQELQDRVSNLLEEKKAANDSTLEAERKLRVAEKKSKDLTARLDDVDEEMRVIKSEKDNRIKSLESRRDKLETDLEELNSKLQSAKKKHSEDIRSAKSNFESLRSEFLELQESNKRMAETHSFQVTRMKERLSRALQPSFTPPSKEERNRSSTSSTVASKKRSSSSAPKGTSRKTGRAATLPESVDFLTDLSEREAQVHSLRAEVRALKTQLRDTSKESVVKSIAAESSDKANDELLRQVDIHKARATNLETRVANLTAKLDTATEEKLAVEEGAAAEREAHSSTKTKLKNVQRDFTEAKKAHKEEVAKVEERLRRVTSQWHSEEEWKDVQTRLRETRQELKNVRLENARKDKIVTGSKKDRQECEELIRDWKTELANLEERLRKAFMDNDRKAAIITDLKGRLDAAKDTEKHETNANNALHDRIQHLTMEVARRDAQLKDLKARERKADKDKEKMTRLEEEKERHAAMYKRLKVESDRKDVQLKLLKSRLQGDESTASTGSVGATSRSQSGEKEPSMLVEARTAQQLDSLKSRNKTLKRVLLRVVSILVDSSTEMQKRLDNYRAATARQIEDAQSRDPSWMAMEEVSRSILHLSENEFQDIMKAASPSRDDETPLETIIIPGPRGAASDYKAHAQDLLKSPAIDGDGLFDVLSQAIEYHSHLERVLAGHEAAVEANQVATGKANESSAGISESVDLSNPQEVRKEVSRLSSAVKQYEEYVTKIKARLMEEQAISRVLQHRLSQSGESQSGASHLSAEPTSSPCGAGVEQDDSSDSEDEHDGGRWAISRGSGDRPTSTLLSAIMSVGSKYSDRIDAEDET